MLDHLYERDERAEGRGRKNKFKQRVACSLSAIGYRPSVLSPQALMCEFDGSDQRLCLIHRFLVFVLRLGIGHNPSARLNVGNSVL